MKKVLIVTYYWPPAGGPGVQRWLKFTKYLGEFGVEPIVYVPENPHYPLQDNSLSDQIPADVKVLKKPIFEPYAVAKIFSGKHTRQISSGIIAEEKNQSLLQKMMLYIRGNFFIPDARVLWVKPSVRFLSDYMQQEGIATVITTGPPHSLHLIGLQLKKKQGVKWIADFRDPWTSIGYHNKLKLNRRSRAAHKRLEKKVLDGADELITTSYRTKEEFEKISSTPVTVITNGYDYEQVETPELDERFSLSHIGSLLSGRNPENLWQALRELAIELPGFAADFRLKLVGAVGEEVLRSIENAGLKQYLLLKGYVSHAEALRLQRSSQILLLIEIDSEETKGIIPGKLFEYMVSQRPVLAVGPEDADAMKLIKETNTGAFFTYSQKEEIKKFITEAYHAFKEDRLQTQPVGLQKYSRKALTAELVKLL